MHGLLVPEEALPKTVQAGVIAPEIPDRSDVQKGAHNAYEIQPMHECRQLGIELERNERPDHVRREEIEEWDQPHDERDGQKAGRKNDPVHDPVLGGGDFQSFALDIDVGMLAQEFVRQIIRPFRYGILRASPAAPDRPYRRIGQYSQSSQHDHKAKHDGIIRPPDLPPQNHEVSGHQIDAEQPGDWYQYKYQDHG